MIENYNDRSSIPGRLGTLPGHAAGADARNLPIGRTVHLGMQSGP
jgi:hypothetical protein